MGQQLAVIVGVGPGLGSALVRCCLSSGMQVVAAARNITARGSALQQHAKPGQLLLQDCDATQPADVKRLFTCCDETSHTPDLAIFNAGAYQPGSVLEINPEDFEQCWRVGCFAGFLVGQAAARRMAASGCGTVIFTGATASLRGGSGFVNLAAPKFGLRAVSQSMARELGPKGIHIAHVVIDGQIAAQGDQTRGGAPGDARLRPDDIAQAYLALHRQQRSAWTLELDLRPWKERF